MVALTDRALVLRRFAYGESSLVCHGFTREHGRVHWLAKGAYRTTSRYFATLDVFDTLEVTWSHTPERELSLLHRASISARRRRIALDLESYRAALTALELCGLASQAGHADPALFDLLEATLERLHLGAPARATLVEFELAFLHNQGLAPALDRCAACGGVAAAIEDGASERRAVFSSGAGGRLCPTCAAQARASGRRVGTLPVAVLEQARRITLEPGSAQQLAPAELEATRDFVARFLQFHLESQPKSYRALLAPQPHRRPRT